MKTKKIILSVCVMLLVALCMPFALTGCSKGPKLSLRNTFQTTYFVDEALNVDGGILDYTDANGKTTQVAITTEMVSCFSSATTGTRDMVITYEDLTVLVSYTVTEIPDVALGSLFRSELREEESINGYVYIYFRSYPYNQVIYMNSSSADETIQSITSADTITMDYTKSMGNRAYVYSCQAPDTSLITITVISSTEIALAATLGGTSMEFNLTLVA